ncbi:FkbM family methyltransferase, partial [Angustibacter aerolatus]
AAASRLAARLDHRVLRRAGVAAFALGPGRVVLDRRRPAARTHAVTERVWLVDAETDRTPTQVSHVDGGAWLVTRRDVDPLLETHTLKLLGDRHVSWLLQRYAVDLVLDVGANVGQFARSIRDGGYTGRIVSFEPVPVHAAQLERAAADDPGWTVRRVALGSEPGTASMRVQREFSSIRDANAYGRERFEALDDDGTEVVEVPVHRLDALLDELLEPLRAAGVEHPRVYLKTDTQGYDLEVFRGLGDRVRDVVAMQAEASLLSIYDGAPRLPEAMTAYEQAGFALTGCYPVSREADGRVIELDCTFVRTGALAETDPGLDTSTVLF